MIRVGVWSLKEKKAWEAEEGDGQPRNTGWYTLTKPNVAFSSFCPALSKYIFLWGKAFHTSSSIPAAYILPGWSPLDSDSILLLLLWLLVQLDASLPHTSSKLLEFFSVSWNPCEIRISDQVFCYIQKLEMFWIYLTYFSTFSSVRNLEIQNSVKMNEKLCLCEAGRDVHVQIMFRERINMKMKFYYSSFLLVFPASL